MSGKGLKMSVANSSTNSEGACGVADGRGKAQRVGAWKDACRECTNDGRAVAVCRFDVVNLQQLVHDGVGSRFYVSGFGVSHR